MERGNVELNPAPADLRATTSAAIEATIGRAHTSEEHIHLVDGDPVEHVHDQHAFELALTYLLSTAMECRTTDDPVAVSVSTQPGTHLVEITYTGNPLSPADQHALSSPIYARPQHAPSDHNRKLSLELAYSRGVVLHHDGSISIRISDTEGDEQSISVQLPAG